MLVELCPLFIAGQRPAVTAAPLWRESLSAAKSYFTWKYLGVTLVPPAARGRRKPKTDEFRDACLQEGQLWGTSNLSMGAG